MTAAQPRLQLVYSREDFDGVELPRQVAHYPELRYMGSKYKLLPWIHGVLSRLDFESAADPFVGAGSVAYLLKAMGKRVVASDFLRFPTVLATATIANNSQRLDGPALKKLLAARKRTPNFIEKTFEGIFFTTEDLRFLDRTSANIDSLEHPFQQALARSALIRSCLKKQPRGVFTISGDLSRYDDGRRDLRLSIEEHFHEQIDVFNACVFDNGKRNAAKHADVFGRHPAVDMVYLDPPYVPRSDDNCYIKRYHFLEGLAVYWKGLTILENTRVKKIEKLHTPFGSRKTAIDAFDRLFRHYRKSKIVLSYSTNAYPDREILEALMRRYKKSVTAYERPHRYHFGTHAGVERAVVNEFLIVGQ